MNPSLAHLLMRLYPRPWRERYAAEFETFLQTGDGGLRTLANVVLSAGYEHLRPTRRGNLDRDSSSFQYWCLRAPWVVFGLAPIFLLAMTYFVACLYLWSGWKIFLPGANTPFGQGSSPIYGIRNIYFQAGKFYYFGAPILVGWAIALVAVKQGVESVWPIVGLSLIAWIGSTAQIHASLTATHGGLRYVSMNFPLGSSVHSICEHPFHALAILSLAGLPYLIWQLLKTRSVSV